MADNLGAFSPKLDELMSAYRSLAEHVSVCQRASPEQLGRELDALKAESAGYERRLEAGTRSRARMAAGLCRAQLRYEREVRSLLAGGLDGAGRESRAESMTLAAEFAMDFAAAAVHNALGAAIAALLLQQDDKNTKLSEDG